ncbi:unnamed protein product [Lepeophtheirus salmonis]|uniref:(salmon louse) hypothetical protein n=1 Tax=Lepeophtheirus salmonis TaxID=72036 RepID=A0A7R8CC87_LEPSM|nr:unnamed protein product [Lepeophtheirus salmonis]CAF2766633.1 unnamed protein product [Lepeophtheirus salmonis]
MKKRIHDDEDKASQIAYADLIVNGELVTFLIDLGTNVNILPRSRAPTPPISKVTGHFMAYGGNKIPTNGLVALLIVMNGSDQGPLEFLIKDVDQPILGSPACLNMKLVSLHLPSFLRHATEECNGKMEYYNHDFEEIFMQSPGHIAMH